MATLEKLQEAIESAETLKIKYNGGSHPGSVREIAPISISKDKVRARCYSSGAVKLFFINKIELCTSSEAASESEWNPTRAISPRYKSLVDLLEKNMAELSDLGWHVVYGKNSISIHSHTKKGNLKLSSAIDLYYEGYTYDLVMDFDSEKEVQKNFRERQRPWILRSDKFNTTTYGNLDKAVEEFMKRARSLSPNIKG